MKKKTRFRVLVKTALISENYYSVVWNGANYILQIYSLTLNHLSQTNKQTLFICSALREDEESVEIM